MLRNPLYIFDDLNSTGINKVPVGSMVQVNDSDGKGTPKVFQVLSKSGVLPATTIADFLRNASNYIDLNRDTEIPSELERIYPDASNQNYYGWRLIGRTESNDLYGTIGFEAIDFSKVEGLGTINTTKYGALGDYSFATGYLTRALGRSSFISGIGTTVNLAGSAGFGKYNRGLQNTIFEIGIGTGEGNRKNALTVFEDGAIIADNLTIDKIQSPFSLVTKEYSDANLDSKLDLTGGIINGNLEIQGELLVRSKTDLDETSIKELEVGLDSTFNSKIVFTDANAGPTKSIYWSTSEQAFMVDALTTGHRIWHSGNDGAGSGLDADTIHGISGSDLATITYVNNGLGSKLDKIGGQINGDLIVNANFSVLQNTSLKSLSVAGAALFESNVAFQSTTTFDEVVYFNTAIAVDNINSINPNSGIITVNSPTIFDKAITAGGLFKVISDFEIGNFDSTNKTSIKFLDPNAFEKQPELIWDPAENQFFVRQKNSQDIQMLYHEGNLPPATNISKFDELLDTPSSKTGFSNKYLRVSADETSIEYVDITADSFINDNAGLNETNVTWSADKIVRSLSGKLDKNNGQAVDLEVSGSNFAINSQSSVFNGNVIINPGFSLHIEEINSSTHFAGSITTDSTITSANNIVSGQAIKVGLTTEYDDNRSTVIFQETISPLTLIPQIYWDTDVQKFKIDDATGSGNIIIHTGNVGEQGFVTPNSDNTFTGSNTFEEMTIHSGGIRNTGEIKIVQVTGSEGIAVTDTNNSTSEPRLFWNSDTQDWRVDTYNLDPSTGDSTHVPNAVIWTSANFDPNTKMNSTGDVSVDGNLTANTLTSAGSLNGSEANVSKIQINTIPNSIGQDPNTGDQIFVYYAGIWAMDVDPANENDANPPPGNYTPYFYWNSDMSVKSWELEGNLKITNSNDGTVKVNISNLPTDPTGLDVGDLYVDPATGNVKVVL